MRGYHVNVPVTDKGRGVCQLEIKHKENSTARCRGMGSFTACFDNDSCGLRTFHTSSVAMYVALRLMNTMVSIIGNHTPPLFYERSCEWLMQKKEPGILSVGRLATRFPSWVSMPSFETILDPGPLDSLMHKSSDRAVLRFGA